MHRLSLQACCILAIPLVGASGTVCAGDARPLHQLIDEQIAAGWKQRGITPAEPAPDAEFLRRAYLDLAGTIPTSAQARAFLDDPAPDKRRRLIDELLARPEYALHMARVLDVMLIERRSPTIRPWDIPVGEWRKYLTAAFAENRPWDRLVAEILGSDGTDPRTGPAVRFYVARDAEPHAVTRDIGRMFLGRDLQCAQCHDDPRYKDYLQADYYGTYAFVQRVTFFRDNKLNRTFVGEKAEGAANYTSVFTGQKGATHPRLPGGAMLADPMLAKGMEYLVAPTGGARPVPQYSRRLLLARELPRRETVGFAANAVNRFWALLLGRGLVEPLDLHHAKNPPSHPELLQLLTERFVEANFDIKYLLRELARTRTYQLASTLPAGVPLPPPESFAVAPLRPLSPEQFAWSVLQASGRTALQLDRADAALRTRDPKHYPALREHWSWKSQAYAPLERDAAALADIFAGQPGQPEVRFEPTVNQALFLLNNDRVLGWLTAEKGLLLDRLAALPAGESIAEELYLSILSRRPSAEETAEVRVHLDGKPTGDARRTALQELVWSRLLSAEFRLNH